MQKPGKVVKVDVIVGRPDIRLRLLDRRPLPTERCSGIAAWREAGGSAEHADRGEAEAAPAGAGAAEAAAPAADAAGGREESADELRKTVYALKKENAALELRLADRSKEEGEWKRLKGDLDRAEQQRDQALRMLNTNEEKVMRLETEIGRSREDFAALKKENAELEASLRSAAAAAAAARPKTEEQAAAPAGARSAEAPGAAEVLRSGPCEIYSEMFTAERYSVHMNASMTLMLISPSPVGKVLCSDGELRISGLDAISRFRGIEALRTEHVGKASVKIRFKPEPAADDDASAAA